MKKLLFALVLSAVAFIPRAQAVSLHPPYLGSISNEVFNQLTIVTNEIAATNNVAANKKLLKVLLGANKLIAKTKTNNIGGTKSLGVLNKSLGRSSLSNTFNPLIQGTADIYESVLDNILDALTTRVNASYPGRSQDAARKALAKFELAIQKADTNTNFLLVLKALSAAAKSEVGAQKATVKAENAPVPPAGVTATLSGAVNGSYKSFVAAISQIGGAFIITSGTKPSASGSDSIALNFSGVGDGTQTVNVNGTFTQLRIGGRVFNGAGTTTVTYNSTSRAVFGTFTFVGDEQGPSTAITTVTGSFSGTAL